jgi:transcriptional regulator with XRE-family HTH domain
MVKAHMDRRELAELTGYWEAQIESWELGRSVLYPVELIKLCHALDVMPEWLLCWEQRRRVFRMSFGLWLEPTSRSRRRLLCSDLLSICSEAALLLRIRPTVRLLVGPRDLYPALHKGR